MYGHTQPNIISDFVCICSVYSYIQFHPLMYLIKLAIESQFPMPDTDLVPFPMFRAEQVIANMRQ